MDKDIKDLLKNNSKDNMPDLWGKIESKLQEKKGRKSRWFLTLVAAIVIIFTIGVINKSGFLNNNGLNQQKVEADEITVLEDLNLKEIVEGKLRASGYSGSNETSYTEVEETSFEAKSSSIIYGKVIDVKSFAEDDLISSDIEIEVIKDYKNNISEGEKILLGSMGGEVTVEEYIKNASEINIWRNEYDKVEDKSKKIIALDNGVPQYREGEYVLVYLFKFNKEVYYSEKEERLIEPPTADYGAYEKLYVNPNTEEVYKYIYDYNSDELIKENVSALDFFENNN